MSELLDERTLRQLERLSLPALRALTAGVAGDVHGPRRRPHDEFADYRRYAPGDDLRRVDWNVYARLRALVVKVGDEEGRLSLDVLVDTSRSMTSSAKLPYAQRLAAALGAVSLLAGHRVRVTALAESRSRSLPPLEGPRRLDDLLAQVASLAPGGATGLAAAVRDYRSSGDRVDLAVLLTDAAVPPGDLDESLEGLFGAATRLGLLHVIARDELEPRTRGDVELVDAETGEHVELVLDDDSAARYAELQRRFLAGVEDACRRHGVAYARAVTDRPPLDALLGAAGDPLLSAA